MRLRTNVKSKAFTLIELLLVISIIGLLTSIVLVGLKKAREKAKIAKTAVWARSVFTELGVDAVLNLNFNDCCQPGGTCTDLSEYGNNGTLKNGVTCAEGVPGFTGKALRFTANNQYVNCPDRPSLRLISGNMTVEAWVKPEVLGKYHTIVAKWVPWIFFITSSNKLNFYTRRSDVSGDQSVSANTALSANQWYHAVVVYTSSDRRATFYLNGKFDGNPTFSYPVAGDGGASVVIGYYGNSNTTFYGKIDEVRIYKRALTAFEIQKHYAEGLLRHQLAEK